MFFVENLKSHIFADECGIDFLDSSRLDIEHCYLTGKVHQNEEGGFSVEIDKIEAEIVNRHVDNSVEGHIDVTKVVSKSNLEDFKEEMIKHALMCQPVEEWGQVDFERA